ncbi:hypothetical protein L1987_23536 [Smallanthus sonchifolius]|uniref:Uncharacterized protein n=1 Tax=Smallanthus sonchifolius TaxID=185202 RepID=A0ACB9IJP4_9ASTR|nr:hypothetical protein L1987_23536 [Smallanthus sonchifolius]
MSVRTSGLQGPNKLTSPKQIPSVTTGISRAVKEAKKNITFKKDKSTIVHVGLGKVPLLMLFCLPIVGLHKKACEIFQLNLEQVSISDYALMNDLDKTLDDANIQMDQDTFFPVRIYGSCFFYLFSMDNTVVESNVQCLLHKEAPRLSIEASVVPAFEISCKTMFNQVDAQGID